MYCLYFTDNKCLQKKRDTNIKSASLEITISMFQQTIQNDLVDGHMQDIF